jgi:hypothetical protein
MVAQEPTIVTGEPWGRLGMSALLHSIDGTTVLIHQIILLLGLSVLALAVLNFILRGRVRNTVFALAEMLTLLAPLLALFAAANTLLFAFIEVANQNAVQLGILSVSLAEAALSLALGALVGAGAVVLKAVLRLVDARDPKPPRPSLSQS